MGRTIWPRQSGRASWTLGSGGRYMVRNTESDGVQMFWGFEGIAGCSLKGSRVRRRKRNEIRNNIYWKHAKKPSRGLMLSTVFVFYDSLERIKLGGGRINTSREKWKKIPLYDEKTAGSESIRPWTPKRWGSGKAPACWELSIDATQAQVWLTGQLRNLIDYPVARSCPSTGPSTQAVSARA